MSLAEQVRPLGDNIILRLIEKPKESAGVHLPDTAALPSQEGVIVAMGPGALRCVHCGAEGQRKEMPPFKVGDRVIFTHWTGSEVRHDGEHLFILKAWEDVVAVVDEVSDP